MPPEPTNVPMLTADFDRSEAREILAQRPPVVRDLEVIEGALPSATMRSFTGAIDAALAGDLSGDALRDLARDAVVDEHVELGLPEQVDEARRDDQSAGVDPLLGLRILQIADRSDAIADDGDIGAEPGRAGPIDDPAAGDEHVVRGWGRAGARLGLPGVRLTATAGDGGDDENDDTGDSGDGHRRMLSDRFVGNGGVGGHCRAQPSWLEQAIDSLRLRL